MNSITAFFKEKTQELNSYDEELEKMEALVEYAKELDNFPEELMTEENRVKGCVSNAYVYVYVKSGKIYFKAYSEALVIRGYLALLVLGLEGRKAEEILVEGSREVRKFLKETNMSASLSPSRANAFGNVLDLILEKVRNEL